MAADQPPSVFRAGGVSYLHIPCGEPSRAADFYEAVFKWTPRRDSDEPAFSDATGHVIGHFIAGEPAPEDTGILLFVYVEDVDAALRRVEQHGGSVTQPPRPEGGLHVATFRDPEGNRIGLWTETRHVRDPRHDHTLGSRPKSRTRGFCSQEGAAGLATRSTVSWTSACTS